jgi:Rrf2 family transcriptional regulator, cysteine metabolism repressor
MLEGSLVAGGVHRRPEGCERTGHCSTEPLWRDVDAAVRRVLGAATLADLVAQRDLLQIEPLPPSLVDR